MGLSRMPRDPLDFISINDDYSGENVVVENEEIVQYHNNTTVRIWYNQQDVDFDPHWHSAVEIIMPVENHYDARIGGQNYRIEPGEILLIPPRELHEILAPSGGGTRFIFLLDIRPLSALKGYANIQAILQKPLFVTRQTYPNIYDEVYETLLQMRNEYFSRSACSELTIYSLFIRLLVTFCDNHSQSEDLFPNVRLYKQQEYVEKFSGVLSYIDAHYMEDLTLEDVAGAAGFSKYHFSRLFKQYTEYTFCDYLCMRRIKAAEELLTIPGLSITEVALQAGFPSISTFNRLFKQQKRCTPSEYRSRRAESGSGYFPRQGEAM